MPIKTNWAEAIKPLLRKYRKKKHPLEYHNHYQLLVMVLLSAQDSDRHINDLAPAFFKAYPNMRSLTKATPASLAKWIGKVRGSRKKISWLLDIAKTVKTDSAIPLTLDQLVELPGIGRKSASVILREAGQPPEGVIVDLHVVRVAPRLGIAKAKDPKKIELELMAALPRREWDAGMAMSFLGREICRPQPQCEICLMRKVCEYYQSIVKAT